MKAVEISVGGKTFIAGEYLALQGGPALILSTEPRFSLNARFEEGRKNPFHPESPAGKFWSEKVEFFSRFQIEFMDPYQVGGFGASSAQFALLHAFWQVKEEAFIESERFFDWHEMLQDYRRISSENGRGPSGADVVGVCSGGLTLFDRNNGKVEMFSWPFQEIEFFLSHTGQKLATHEHLQVVKAFETTQFEKAMGQIQEGLSLIDIDGFILGLQAYRHELESQDLVAAYTREKVKNLEKNSEVLFAKGCGAMGSDVILTFCRKENSEFVAQLLQKEKLQVIAKASQITGGLKIQNQTKSHVGLSV